MGALFWFFMPKVSIIIPVCGQADMTKKCLETLYKFTPKDLIEIIVINNNSPDNTLEMLKAFPDVKVITNEMNKSFSVSINQGVNESTGEFVLPLNNDTYFFQNWLEEMLETFTDKKVAVVGAKLLFPDGKIQHAGLACYKNKQPFHVFWGEMPSEKNNIQVEYPAVTFACALIRRKVFEELQGLSLEYPDGNYEDVDFCLRAREKGYKIVYNPKVVLYHLEAGTKKLDLTRAQDTIRKNLKIYKDKWEKRSESLFAVDQRIFPKILVGCPTYYKYEYCLEKYAKIVKNLMYPNYDILLIDNSPDEEYMEKIQDVGLKVEQTPYRKKARDRIVESRNLLKKRTLKGNYDYMFSLEQDVIPEPDILKKLLSHDKKIISGFYFSPQKLMNGDVAIKPIIFKFHKKEGKWGTCRMLTKDETWSDELMNIAYCGVGCLLVHKDVLEKVTFRYKDDKDATDDKYFCYDARKADFEIWADASVKCKHLLEEKFDWDELRDKGEY
tara:strand:- start:2536 stop:4029 length:1494 start_codon:yes stop_codon:yes gene_type:complete